MNPNKGILKKSFFIILLSIITINVIIFIYYSYHYFSTYKKIGHQVHMNNVLSIIMIAERTPPEKLKARVEAVSHSNIKIAYTRAPKYTLQFNHMSVDRIETILENYRAKSRFLQVSYRYGNQHTEPSGILQHSHGIDRDAARRQNSGIVRSSHAMTNNGNQWINISVDKQKISYSKYLSTPILLSLIGLFVQLILIFIVFSYYVATKKFTAILNNIREGASQIGLSMKDAKNPIYGPNIAKEAGITLYLMKERVKQLIVERVATLAGLSHDVKTPLTRAKLMIELEKNFPRKQQILEEMKEIEYLIDQTLQYARSDYANEEKSSIDMVSLIETVCHEIEDLGHPVHYDSPLEKFIFYGQQKNLKRAFTNLIHNAVQYGKQATIRLSQERSKFFITILDNGPEIPEADIEKVFAPFFRGSNTKAKNPSGSGLGLSIAQSAILANDGGMEVTNLKPNGLKVRVVFNISGSPGIASQSRGGR